MPRLTFFLIILAGALAALPALAQEPPSAAPQAEPQAAPPPAPAAADPAALFAESDRAWETRHIAGDTEKSIRLAEEALAKGGDEFESKWRVARGCFWVAEQSPKDDVKIAYGEKGWKAGERAAELKPARVEGWFWGVVALGQYSTGVGIGKAFFKGLGGKFEKMNGKAIAIDPRYSDGGPTRSLGRYWYKVPAIKRDLEESEKLLKQSLAVAPKKLRTHFYLAETYLADDQKDKAKAEIDLCLSLDPKDEEYPDGIVFKKECEKLKKEAFGQQ
ncbi:MAG: tetratricopeptide repeat protein [Myxococcales bacterium]|nr:MAG: tetratricopeptide repeat protein [Myxococcales bacterium]